MFISITLSGYVKASDDLKPSDVLDIPSNLDVNEFTVIKDDE